MQDLEFHLSEGKAVFIFAKCTSIVKCFLKSMGKCWKGTKAKTWDNEGHDFCGL